MILFKINGMLILSFALTLGSCIGEFLNEPFVTTNEVQVNYKAGNTSKFFLNKEAGESDPSKCNYEAYGDVKFTRNEVILVPDRPNKRGAIWSRKENSFKEWEVYIRFRIGEPSKNLNHDATAEGLAFWYTSKLDKGPVFGSAMRWKGLGIFLDTLDNDHSGDCPQIQAVYNNNSYDYPYHLDGKGHTFSHCVRKLTHQVHPSLLHIKYANSELIVELDNVDGTGVHLERCFSYKPIFLEQGYHFGLSTACNKSSDQVVIYDLKVIELIKDELREKSVDSLYDDGYDYYDHYRSENPDYLGTLDKEEKKYNDYEKQELTTTVMKIYQTSHDIVDMLMNLHEIQDDIHDISMSIDTLEHKVNDSLRLDGAITKELSQIKQIKTQINEIYEKINSAACFNGQDNHKTHTPFLVWILFIMQIMVIGLLIRLWTYIVSRNTPTKKYI